LNQLNFDWKKWSGGEKIISISFVTAFASMFLNWTYGSFFPQNGFTQLAIVLLLFWVYPVYGVLFGGNINKYFAYLCSLGSFIAIVYYIYSKNAEIFGGFMNLAGNGAWVFLFSTLMLGIGVFQCDCEYRKQANQN